MISLPPLKGRAGEGQHRRQISISNTIPTITLKKAILFITWDSDTSNYLESLFFPIFRGIQESSDFRIHTLQFSWASDAEVNRIGTLAAEGGLIYSHQPISRKRIPGLVVTLWKGIRRIKTYLGSYPVAAVMPRSTNPAVMVNYLYPWLRQRGIKIVFDADGLPLQERVDFLGRNPDGIVMTWLKKQETFCLKTADKVLTRSQKAIDIHLSTLESSEKSKFHVVSNGRNPSFFIPNTMNRNKIRYEMGMGEDDTLWIYAGTLGPEYELADMLSLFGEYHKRYSGSRFLILTRNLNFFHTNTPQGTPSGVTLMETSFRDIPGYLSAADVAISLRKPAKSLVGLAPVKLGEYLIMGLPVINTASIGDIDEWLNDKPFCFLYDKDNLDNESCIKWVNAASSMDKAMIRDFGIQRFGLENSIAEYLKALKGLSC